MPYTIDYDYSEWVQPPDRTVVLGYQGGEKGAQSDVFIGDGRASVDAPRGYIAVDRQFQSDYPEQRGDVIEKSWTLIGQFIFDSNVPGPVGHGGTWPTPLGTPKPVNNNRGSQGYAANTVAYTVASREAITSNSTLTVRADLAAMAFKHSDLVSAAGPLGTGPLPSNPTVYFADYFAAEANGRNFTVEYESATPTVLDVKARPDQLSAESFGFGSLQPPDATWWFKPMDSDVPLWGPYFNPTRGYTFATGGGSESWTETATAIGTAPSSDDPLPGDAPFASIDWQAAVAAEAELQFQGYGFYVDFTDFRNAQLPAGALAFLDSTNWTVNQYRRTPIVQFQMQVTPTRVRARYETEVYIPGSGDDDDFVEEIDIEDLTGQFMRTY